MTPNVIDSRARVFAQLHLSYEAQSLVSLLLGSGCMGGCY